MVRGTCARNAYDFMMGFGLGWVSLSVNDGVSVGIGPCPSVIGSVIQLVFKCMSHKNEICLLVQHNMLVVSLPSVILRLEDCCGVGKGGDCRGVRIV